MHDPMAFLKKKRVKFSVDFEVCRLTDVPLLNATLFAKVRLLDGGSFESFTNHGNVESHQVILGPKFNFPVSIPANISTGQLEDCKCKVSVRKEDRGGRATIKLGYVIVNLSEFAASGVNDLKQSYLLDGYNGNQRQDNSRVHINVRMTHQGADPMFKVPNMALTSTEEAELNPIDRKAPSRTTPPATNLDETKNLLNDSIFPPQKSQSTVPTPSTPYPTPSIIDRASWHGQTDSISIASSNAFSSSSNTGTVISSGIGSLPSSSASPQLSTVTERSSMPPGISSGKHQIRRMSDDRLSSINRVQRTRHDAADVIDEVIAETSVLHERTRTLTNDDEDDDNRPGGLTLFVGKDGEAVIGQHSMCSPTTTTLQRVHIGDTLASL
uniref:C2 NT-type domain-containing protein n=1 Tax=Panagrolaimus sp. JU765 TaxID=591449 RepID=A0AC34QJ39_9BILA